MGELLLRVPVWIKEDRKNAIGIAVIRNRTQNRKNNNFRKYKGKKEYQYLTEAS